MNDLKIYICTHKDFSSPVKSDYYKIIDARKINVNLPFDDLFYSEFYQFKWVNDNLELPEYIGFCHYRKYFSFLDNIPDMDKIFENHDVITLKPLFTGNNRKQYEQCHNVDDLDIVKNIINNDFKEYKEAFEIFENNNILFPCNMFIMKREDFKEYIKFIFNVLDKYTQIAGDINKRIEDNKKKYLKNFYPNNTIWYQYRIAGYIGERLTNVFIYKHFKNPLMYDMIQTEDKYKKVGN